MSFTFSIYHITEAPCHMLLNMDHMDNSRSGTTRRSNIIIMSASLTFVMSLFLMSTTETYRQEFYTIQDFLIAVFYLSDCCLQLPDFCS